MSELPEIIINREFNAPRALVWRAWTDPELVSRWYGPNIETTIHKFDLKPDGMWLNEMKMGGQSNYQKMVFQEVSKPEKLVWHHYSSVDSDWNETDNPMMKDWPLILLTTVMFENKGEKTNVRFSQIPFDATDAEITSFAKMIDGMSQGWGKGFSIMEELLAELQAR